MRGKKKLKHKELWIKIRDLIRSIIKNSDDYDQKYMKIKFKSDDKLPLNKVIQIPNMIIVARAIFHENKKYYLQVFSDECLYKLEIIKMVYYDRIDVSEGIDVNKTSASKECDVCLYWYFLNYRFKFQPSVCNRCHSLLMLSVNLSNVAILYIKGSDYCCIISLISKNETITYYKMLI